MAQESIRTNTVVDVRETLSRLGLDPFGEGLIPDSNQRPHQTRRILHDRAACPILSPDQLPISLGTPLDGRSKTVVSDLINPHGFVVFRGYGVSSDQEFHDFIECFGLPNFTYAESFSNAVRRNRTPRVFTANEAPPEIEIFLHHEMAQTLVSPVSCFSFVNKPRPREEQRPLVDQISRLSHSRKRDRTLWRN